MDVYKINFEPLQRRGNCQDDESLLDCARKCRVGISSIRGGQGRCVAMNRRFRYNVQWGQDGVDLAH